MKYPHGSSNNNMTNNNLCRYYVATEEGYVVSWFRFIAGEVELTVKTPKQAELVLSICRMFGKGCSYVSREDYETEPYWHIKDNELCTSRIWLENDAIGDSWTVDEYIAEHTVGKLIEVSQEKWDSIGSDYKGTWQDYYDECPEWKGKKVVMSGCITEDPTELGKLLVEGVHFRIAGKEWAA